uniref:Dynein light chain Tctex-type 2B n=1 Tax=Scleropages formosus TaxID=113540 RepID=A0A8C9RRZ1_SCLFO
MEKNETMERNTYIIGPDPQRKFKAAVAKECIRQIIGEAMTGRQYNPQEIPSLSRSLADSIKDKLKEAGFDRYKLVVQVIIGQQRGETIKVASRFLWDADTDNFAQDVFVNSILCGHCIWLLLLLRMDRVQTRGTDRLAGEDRQHDAVEPLNCTAGQK